jgi:hypothetical protein
LTERGAHPIVGRMATGQWTQVFRGSLARWLFELVYGSVVETFFALVGVGGFVTGLRSLTGQGGWSLTWEAALLQTVLAGLFMLWPLSSLWQEVVDVATPAVVWEGALEHFRLAHVPGQHGGYRVYRFAAGTRQWEVPFLSAAQLGSLHVGSWVRVRALRGSGAVLQVEVDPSRTAPVPAVVPEPDGAPTLTTAELEAVRTVASRRLAEWVTYLALALAFGGYLSRSMGLSVGLAAGLMALVAVGPGAVALEALALRRRSARLTEGAAVTVLDGRWSAGAPRTGWIAEHETFDAAPTPQAPWPERVRARAVPLDDSQKKWIVVEWLVGPVVTAKSALASRQVPWWVLPGGVVVGVLAALAPWQLHTGGWVGPVFGDRVALVVGGLVGVLGVALLVAPGAHWLKVGAAVGLVGFGALDVLRGVGRAQLGARSVLAVRVPCSETARLSCVDECFAGSGDACVKAGSALQYGSHDAGKDLDRALTVLRHGCELGSSSACLSAWHVAWSSSGKKRDADLAISLRAKACELGAGEACVDQGLELERAKDFTGAGRLYRRGCELSEGAGCLAAANLLNDGLGGPVDLPLALSFYERGCAVGDASACNGAGFAYDHARGASEDPARAWVLYGRACGGDSARGCWNASELVNLGRGTIANQPMAVALADKACRLGSMGGCTSLGVHLLYGQGVAKDEARAYALFDKACGTKNADACANVGVCLRDGLGVAKDQAKALTVFTEQCKTLPRACGLQGLMVAETDPAAGKPLLERACSAGVAFACEKLGK